MGGSSAISRRILDEIRDRGPVSKSQLVDLVGVPRSRVGAELERFAALGLVEPAGTAESTGGRRSSLVRIHQDVRYVVLHLGTVSTRVGVLDGGLRTLSTLRIDAGLSTAPDAAFAEARAAAGRLLAAHEPAGARGRARVLGAALVVSGDLDATADGPPFARTPGGVWEIADRLDELGRALGAPVTLVPAAHAEALGETLGEAGPARGETLFVRLGATVGAVSVVDGALCTGGPLGGPIGHLRLEPFGPACSCGGSGCLDVMAGGAAIMREVHTAAAAGRSDQLARLVPAGGGGPRLADVLEVARAGDASMAQIAGEVAQRVGAAVAGPVAFTTPDRLVVGGPFSGLGDQLLLELRAALQRVAPPRSTRSLTVELGRQGPAACLVGAARAAGRLVDLDDARHSRIS